MKNSFFLLTLSALILVSCSTSSEDQILGVWNAEESYISISEEIPLTGAILNVEKVGHDFDAITEFKEDGTFNSSGMYTETTTSTINGAASSIDSEVDFSNYNGTYEILEDDKIRFTVSGQTNIYNIVELSNTKLTYELFDTITNINPVESTSIRYVRQSFSK